MEETLDAARVFLASFVIASLAGLSQHLQLKNVDLTVRNVLAVGLFTGISGLIVALLWYEPYREQKNLYYLIGLAGLAGLSGPRMMAIALSAVRGSMPEALNVMDDDPSKKEPPHDKDS